MLPGLEKCLNASVQAVTEELVLLANVADPCDFERSLPASWHVTSSRSVFPETEEDKRPRSMAFRSGWLDACIESSGSKLAVRRSSSKVGIWLSTTFIALCKSDQRFHKSA